MLIILSDNYSLKDNTVSNFQFKMSIRLVPLDAYCMLTITMEDLFPGNSWNYVFGWAMYKARTGVFSFLRYDPKFLGRSSSESEMTKEETKKVE